jgi:hypothetical protein
LRKLLKNVGHVEVKLLPRLVSNACGREDAVEDAVAIASEEVVVVVVVAFGRVVFAVEGAFVEVRTVEMLNDGMEASLCSSRMRGGTGGSLRSTSNSPFEVSVSGADLCRKLEFATPS